MLFSDGLLLPSSATDSEVQELASQQENYLKYVKQLKSNKLLQTVLQNAESKAAYLSALKAMIRELEENQA